MHSVVTLIHSPENCWAPDSTQEMAREWVTGIDARAEDHGVTPHASVANPSEHTLHFLPETESYTAVSGFLGPPLLQDHEVDVVPALPIGEAVDTVVHD